MAWLCLATSLAFAAEPATELQAISNERAAMGVKLNTLTDVYLKPELVGAPRKFSERLTDAEILFLLGDYRRASLVLYELVADSHNRPEPLYGKAVAYLAESLFQIGHYLAARDEFQALMGGGTPQDVKQAVRRLIQIADLIRRWDGVEEHVAVLQAQGPLPADIAYIHAKSLLRQGLAAEAITRAREVPEEHRLHAKAAYVAAVAEVRRGNFQDALSQFAALTQTADSYEDAAEIRELAAMDRGRLLLEAGKVAESIDAYQQVQRSSSLFEQSLYEVTWTFVRAAAQAADEPQRIGEYKKALEALEILLLSEAENPLAPEARLLFGNIQLRLSLYPEATATFDEVARKYEPISDQLETLVARRVDPAAYLGQILGKGTQGGNLIPTVAAAWAREAGELQQALSVHDDFAQAKQWAQESGELVDKLLAALGSEQRMSFFPALREAQGHALGIENSLVGLSERLLALERAVIGEHMSKAAAAELEKLLAERAELEPRYRKLPQKKEDYEGRLGVLRQSMLKLQQAAYRQRYEIDSMRAQMRAIDVWLANNRDLVKPSDEKTTREQLAQQEREVAVLERTQEELEAEISRERDLMGLASEAEAKESEVRARYGATLEKEHELLVAGAAEAPPSARALLAQIDEERAVIARFHAELESFRGRLAAMVGRKAEDLKAEVLREQGSLGASNAALARVGEEAGRVVGEVAQASLSEVARRFRDVVLRADVGSIDVAWQLKEEETREITRHVNDQRRELKALDDEFQDVLEEP